jgi:Cof subfamily protein (haloacid dehalogenase superfamily)
MTRPAYPVRLIALDLDGTLIGSDLVIPPRTRAAIAAAMAGGVLVTIATGRMYRSTVPYAAALGSRAPIICYQGGYIREMPGPGGEPGRLLYHRPMVAKVAREAITWAWAHGFEPHVNIDDRLVAQMGNATIAAYIRRAGVAGELVPDLLRAVVRRPTKVLAVAPEPRPRLLLDEARAAFGSRAYCTVSHRDYLEWNASGVHKGRALRWLARRLEIPLGNVMAIGDQLNDAEMLAAVGHGVAMGESPVAANGAARRISGTLAEDGAAVAIEALLGGREGVSAGVAE